MPREVFALVCACALWLGLFAGFGAVASQPSSMVEGLSAARSRGCEGRPGVARRLRETPALNQAARLAAGGADASAAARQAGYRSRSLTLVNLSGYRSVDAVADVMAARYCQALIDPRLSDVGIHQSGGSVWILLAAPFDPPAMADAASVAAQVLAGVNEARATARRCGAEQFAAAPPLRANAALARTAASHASDMARLSYLDHQGRDGSSPSDRATRAGYEWRSVGENIAAGQANAVEVVAGWLRSPGHCANIMEPRFTEMGVAFAVNAASEAGIYWAQLLARPR